MNTTTALPDLRLIPLGELFPSKTNPRQHFDADALAELAESLKTQGIRQPILVRPAYCQGTNSDADLKLARHAAAGTLAVYEIVAGERRYKAAGLAKLDAVPCLVTEMPDWQALEIQVVENLQRADLTELEEAASYQQMLAVKLETGEPRYTVPVLAERFGVERSQIYRRLKLLDLPPEGKEALDAGKIGSEQALQVARVPDPKARAEALKRVLKPQHGTEPLTKMETREMIAKDFMVGLKGAPFKLDDATLHPEAGACSACPKMTDNCMQLLSPEEAKEAAKRKVCCDPACYRTKLDLVWKARAAEAKQEGRTVLSEKESAEIYPSWQDAGEMNWDSAYVELSAKPMASLLKAEVVEKVGTWRKLIEDAEKTSRVEALAAITAKIKADSRMDADEKKRLLEALHEKPTEGAIVPRLLARDQAGRPREVVKRELAITAIEAGGDPIFAGKIGGAAVRGSDADAKARKRELDAAKLRLAETLEGMGQLHAALVAKWVPSPMWEAIFESAMGHAGADGLWLVGKWKGLKFDQHGSGKDEAVGKWAMSLPAAERQALVPLLLIGQRLKYSGLGDDFQTVVEGSGLDLDVKKIRAEAAAKLKGAKEKKPKEPTKKDKKAASLAAAAAEFGWNQNGVAEKPELHDGMGHMPEGTQCQALMAMAPDGEWRFGLVLRSRTEGKQGVTYSPNLIGKKFKNYDDALDAAFTEALPFFKDDPAAFARVAVMADEDVAAQIATEGRPEKFTRAQEADEIATQVEQLYNAGRTRAEIAKECGISLPKAANLIKEIARRNAEAKEMAPPAPVTQDPTVLAQWQKAYAADMPVAEIARSYGATVEDVAGALGLLTSAAPVPVVDTLNATLDEMLPGLTAAARTTILAKYIKRVCGLVKPEADLTPAERMKIADILAMAKAGRAPVKVKVSTANEEAA
jgi:ParB/RepB/Spo0J family partition protein